jgi:hypothetical protein
MDKDEFLKLIRKFESSDGTNKTEEGLVPHRTIAAGPHKGDNAMGEYGIMPNTASEFITRRKMRGQFGPDEAIMSQMKPKALERFLADNKRVETNLAGDIADRVLGRSKGDDEKAFYMWEWGHNRDPRTITPSQLDNSNHVKKFRFNKVQEALNKKQIPGNIDLTKRPKVQNDDGSYSTVRTMTITTDQGAVNIPTVVNGRVVSEKEAMDHYRKTGEHLGIYGSVDEAVKEAEKLHDEQAELYGK